MGLWRRKKVPHRGGKCNVGSLNRQLKRSSMNDCLHCHTVKPKAFFLYPFPCCLVTEKDRKVRGETRRIQPQVGSWIRIRVIVVRCGCGRFGHVCVASSKTSFSFSFVILSPPPLSRQGSVVPRDGPPSPPVR